MFCFAVKEEARPFQKLLGNRADIAVVVTGMGQRNAEAEFRKALTEYQPKQVITGGFAGGLDPALKTGTVVFSADDSFTASPALLAAGASPARFCCEEKVAVTATEKTALRKSTGADAVEMESEVIRSICRERQIPSATVRVISDAANENLPLDFNQLMTAEQKMDFVKLALTLVKSPGKIGELMRFQKTVTYAANRLAATLQQTISH